MSFKEEANAVAKAAEEGLGPSMYCRKCKKNVEYEIREGLAECDTPIGTIQTAIDKAYCKECGEEVSSKVLRDKNYLLMVKATIAFWRKINPDGTKKQCRRALGLQTHVVDFFWDICREELPAEENNGENSES